MAQITIKNGKLDIKVQKNECSKLVGVVNELAINSMNLIKKLGQSVDIKVYSDTEVGDSASEGNKEKIEPNEETKEKAIKEDMPDKEKETGKEK